MARITTGACKFRIRKSAVTMASTTHKAHTSRSNAALIIICQAAGWGLYTGLVIYALCILWLKQTKSASRVVLVVVTVGMHALSTVIAALSIKDAWINLVEKPLSVSNPVDSSNPFLPMFLMTLNYTIGDMVFLWRVYVLYNRKLFPCAIPAVLLLGAFGSMIAEEILQNPAAFPFSSEPNAPLEPCITIYIIFACSSTICSMAAIGMKTLAHRRHVTAYVGKNTASSRFLLFMVESGGLYCFDWLVCLGLYFSRSPRYLVLLNLSSQVIGVFPTAFIVAATLIFDRSPGRSNCVVSTLHFREEDQSRPTITNDSSEITLGGRNVRIAGRIYPETQEDQRFYACARCLASKSQANYHHASVPSAPDVKSSCV